MEIQVENASSGPHSHSVHHPEKLELVIISDGGKKPLNVAPEELIQLVLQQAIAIFGPPPNPHLLSLFTEVGEKLPENVTVKEAGLMPGEKLLLCPTISKIEFDVVIIYNGIKKPIKVKLDELIKTVLQKAIALFGSPPNPHLLSLFTEAGRELPEAETVKQVGLHPDEKLLLRPSAVKGG
jgi:hypothetical protein